MERDRTLRCPSKLEPVDLWLLSLHVLSLNLHHAFCVFCDGVLCEWVELSTSNFKDLLRQISDRNNNLCRNYLDGGIYVQTPKLMGI